MVIILHLPIHLKILILYLNCFLFYQKYFQNINKDEDFDLSINNLAESKKVIFDFFDNVIVNEHDITIKKNRLELIQMLCKTFDYYVNFSLIDSLQ